MLRLTESYWWVLLKEKPLSDLHKRGLSKSTGVRNAAGEESSSEAVLTIQVDVDKGPEWSSGSRCPQWRMISMVKELVQGGISNGHAEVPLRAPSGAIQHEGFKLRRQIRKAYAFGNPNRRMLLEITKTYS